MSVVHRPSDETLAAFAGGQLDEGLAVVVACHVAADRRSRERLHELEAVHGALLDRVEPVAMMSGPQDLGHRAPPGSPDPAGPPPHPG